MIYVAIFGASIMSYFIGLTRVSDELVALLQGMNIPPLAVISLLVVMYLVLGAVFDETAAMLITLVVGIIINARASLPGRGSSSRSPVG